MLQVNFDVNMLETRSVSIQFLLKSPGSRGAYNFQENSPDAFHGRGGISMVVAVAVFSSLATDPMGPWEPLLVLNAGNGWEWGLLGWLLIVIVDHSRVPY